MEYFKVENRGEQGKRGGCGKLLLGGLECEKCEMSSFSRLEGAENGVWGGFGLRLRSRETG